MADYRDLVSLVRDPVPRGPIPAIWDYAPCHASLVGGLGDMRRYYFDVEAKIALQERVKERFPEALILPGIWPDLGVVIEASAFGGRLRWSRQGAPHIYPSVTDVGGVDRLVLPNPEEDGLLPLYLMQMKEMRRRLGGRGREPARVAVSMGPSEIAGLVLGYELFYLSLYQDPDTLGRFLDLLTEFIIGWLHRQEKTHGPAELVIIGDHVPHQVSPAHVEAFILPRMRAIYDEFPHSVRMYHNEGFHGPEHVKLVERFGCEVWHFGSDRHALDELYGVLDKGMCLFGGLNPLGVLRSGTPEEVARETLACVGAARGRRLLLSSGTGTTPDVPPENVLAMVAAVSATP